MLIEGDSVSQQGLVTTGFVLLVHFPVLQQLDLVLHEHYLLLHIQDVLFLQVLCDLVLLGSECFLLLLFMAGF